jgi:hypothetical protein
MKGTDLLKRKLNLGEEFYWKARQWTLIPLAGRKVVGT